MTESDRIERMADLLKQVWLKYPELRLGQLVTNAPYFNAEGQNTDSARPVFMVEDERMEEGLNGLLKFEETP